MAVELERVVLIDRREQLPWFADGEVATRPATLRTGDYSLTGCKDLIAVERKELGDLISCVTAARGRFERELARLRDEVEHGHVIVEAGLPEIASGNYRSKTAPAAIVGTLAAWALDYGVGVWLAHDRRHAERLCLRLFHVFERRLGSRTNREAKDSAA